MLMLSPSSGYLEVFIHKQWSQETTHFGLRFDISKNWKNYSPETNTWNLKMPPTPHPKKGNTHLWVVKLQTFFMFTPEIGEDEPLLTTVIFFKRGLNQTTNQTSTRSTKFFGELPNRKLLRKGLGTTPRCLGCQWPFWWSGGALRCLSDPPVVKVMKSMFWTWSKGTLPKTYRGGIILRSYVVFFER